LSELAPWLEPLLRDVLAHQRGHALLLHGPSGLGHFELALALAGAWLCEGEEGAPPPCGRCASCRLIAARTHPDLQLLLPEDTALRVGWSTAAGAGESGDADGAGRAAGKKKPSREIKVDAVRPRSPGRPRPPRAAAPRSSCCILAKR
jgi:DNA polymerase-3 subunit delta'